MCFGCELTLEGKPDDCLNTTFEGLIVSFVLVLVQSDLGDLGLKRGYYEMTDRQTDGMILSLIYSSVTESKTNKDILILYLLVAKRQTYFLPSVIQI